MKKEIITGKNGYDIPCNNNITGKEKKIVIISHGFGSSKESPTAEAISDAFSKHNIGTYRFDFPAHGESQVDGEMLRISNCTNDLAAVEAHVRKLMPKSEIGYFSSSFGAYINLIYLATHEHTGYKSFLRCAAVDMPKIFKQNITPEHVAQLHTHGFVMLDLDYFRPLKITPEFIADLEAHNIFKLYRSGMTKIAMIHGTADETASIHDARRFAKKFGADLTEVESADHRFLIPNGMERVIYTALNFFTTS